MPTNHRANPLALAVLSCLYERPMHPYEVAQTLRHRAKHESIRLNYGSLYNVVEGLEKRGFIRVTETVREGRRPERTVYEITETGSREFIDWLSALVTTPVKEYLQFEAALSLLAGVPPAEAAALLRQRTAEIEHRLSISKMTLDGMRTAGLPRLFALEVEYQDALMQAELEYVRTLVKEIEGGTLDGIEMWRHLYEGDTQSRPPPPQPDP
ncbi:MAG: helix-turn-helix transcriptional regulator [Actinobacteria bacterium]|nr:helix-turn-helix transcriptional regulator [Actinomycetota bacterium]